MRRTSVLIGVVAALACGCGKNAVDQEIEATRSAPDSAGLAAVVGWYDVPGLGQTLVTWGAEAPLTLFALRDTVLAARLFALDKELFTWGGGQSASGTVRLTETAGERILVREDGERRISGRQVVAPPYDVRPISYTSRGVRLRGTLFDPPGDGPHAAVVMIHGSGESTRDNSWYMQIVDALAAAGTAVLFPDKRGSGGSEGEWLSAGLDVFAADALAGVAALRAVSGIDTARVGVVGISQGGRVAALAAAGSEAVRFVVAVSAAAVPLEDQLEHETTQDLRRSRWPRFLHPVVRSITVRSVKSDRPEWWRSNGWLDPIDAWRRVEAPALVVYGADDENDNVPVARSVARLRELNRSDLEIRIYEGSGHALYEPDGGQRIRADFLTYLLEWIPPARDR